MVIYICMAVIAYLIGSINFSVIFSKKFAGFDLREKGSGNAGTTNVLRTVGKKAAALTLICDILKGIVAIGMAILLGLIPDMDKDIMVQVAAVAVVIGHTFPIFFKFKGGKGVATSLGILLMVNWQIGLICLVFGLVLIILTRMVSLGSVTAAILYPVLTVTLMGDTHYIASLGNGEVGKKYIVYSIILAVIILFNHRSNIKRILEGNENKISFKNPEN